MTSAKRFQDMFPSPQVREVSVVMLIASDLDRGVFYVGCNETR